MKFVSILGTCILLLRLSQACVLDSAPLAQYSDRTFNWSILEQWKDLDPIARGVARCTLDDVVANRTQILADAQAQCAENEYASFPRGLILMHLGGYSLSLLRSTAHADWWATYQMPLPYPHTTVRLFNTHVGYVLPNIVRVLDDAKTLYRHEDDWHLFSVYFRTVSHTTGISNYTAFRQCLQTHHAVLKHQRHTKLSAPPKLPPITLAASPPPPTARCIPTARGGEWCDTLDEEISTLDCPNGRSCRRKDFSSVVTRYQCICKLY